MMKYYTFALFLSVFISFAGAVQAAEVLAREYTIKEISDPAGNKPYYFEPSSLTIQPGDTVTFVNAQEDMHDVMFDVVPKNVDAMIMAPMQGKAGEKWSYTFTVPGTYHFHCHPHQALGMKGTLIVGRASKPGETRTVDHEAMEHMDMGDHAANAAPEGKGKINSIDAEKRTINMTHQPIEALKWPGMTMGFPVAKEVDLSSFKAGDVVAFTLKSGEDNQYWIASLKAADNDHKPQ
jgi:plastocyanin